MALKPPPAPILPKAPPTWTWPSARCWPARYNPLEDPAAATGRQSVVLGLMAKQGYISQAEADLAAGEKLGLAAVPFPIEAPHFVMYVRGQLEKQFGLE